MSDQEQQLGKLRQEIDRIDQQILQLVSDRARCAQQVAEVKQTAPDQGAVFYRPEREAQVLRRIMDTNPGPLDGEEVAKVFRQIMSACLALEQPMHIAFLGPEGTFTQAAALKHFGHSVISVPLHSIDEVFREVESGAAHYGVVPIENSTEGMVHHTLDMFRESTLTICGEVELRIHQHLLAADGVDLDNVSRIYSHQQSLAQCRRWLDARYPGVERVAVSSNAEAARRAAAEKDEQAVAIAGDMAAELYNLKAVVENIEDQPDNTTRFLVVGNQLTGPSGRDKTSMLVAARNKPGALYHLLEPFHRFGISLTRIETRPSGMGTWGYIFYIDCEGHYSDAPIQKVMKEIGDEAQELKLLGSYPQAVL
ncbi:prephenate dehydratase [Motiliproteus sp. SC1-56]|uniref:prephenate dehydratase n=1 Tax=Motiliproteus sp. SC1-56 TaxID=2799565 RepID=UPI001A8C5116|nr:prephenate dehydratase [Motiliproteus sp. SC1-56]